MTDLFDAAEGATPIDPSVAAGLKADWIATRGELNAAEQQNILAATAWAMSRRARWTIDELADPRALARLHRRMFADVWTWAGQFRRVDLNIGVEWWRIPTELESLCRDVRAQAGGSGPSPWTEAETAVRFHHRLVAIHAFPNGNGRHARLCADLVVRALGGEPLTWGGRILADESAARTAYVAALRRADQNLDYAPLVAFATA